jgi:tetratricopeptide (TPR) repeat protein
MSSRYAVAGLALVLLVVAVPAAADSTQAARSFEVGRILLAKADFDGALEAFKLAAELDPKNDKYFSECAILQRVLKIRKQMEAEQDTDMALRMAGAVHDYFVQHKVDVEALKVARMMHAKRVDADTTHRLAQSLLNLDQNAEALETVDALAADQQTDQTRIDRGIALARMQRMDEAKAIAGEIKLTKDCGPGVCLDAARLHALAGHKDQAIDALKCSFECTPPNQLRDAVVAAKECPDFATLIGTNEFRNVSMTESKVSAGCGSKAGCGGCSKSKTGCSKAAAEKSCDDTKAAGGNAPAHAGCDHGDKK